MGFSGQRVHFRGLLIDSRVSNLATQKAWLNVLLFSIKVISQYNFCKEDLVSKWCQKNENVNLAWICCYYTLWWRIYTTVAISFDFIVPVGVN